MVKLTLFYLSLTLICIEDVTCNFFYKIKHGANNRIRIVGGKETSIQKYPYQAYLLLYDGRGYYSCGGSIISKFYILTAAHCLSGIKKIYVRIGSSKAKSGGYEYETRSFLTHPMYDHITLDYDAGLVHIRQGMKLDRNNTNAVRLVRFYNDPEEGKDVTLTGWGDTVENGTASNTLRVVEVPVVDRDDCEDLLEEEITPRMFCAGELEGGKDTCQGDSGGPAVLTSTGRLAGITSYGYGCGDPDSPGVYTRIGNMEIRIFIYHNAGV